MIYTYNPLKTTYKSVTGAIACEQEITFRIYKIQDGEGFTAENCNMCLCKDGEDIVVFPMEKTDYGFSLTLKFHTFGLYFYYFKLGEYYLSCGKMHKGELSERPTSWQITVYESDFTTPDWLKGGIIYQIFPDRFNKVGDTTPMQGKIMRSDWGGMPSYKPNMFGKVLNNDFFGGNFKGIRQKLDYLSALGVTAIYLNPIFEAYSNHRYDTGDYMKIDPVLGTEEDFDDLITAAREHGIKIILDGVFNHTGDDSRYFNRYGNYDELGAFQSYDSKYRDWYSFRRYPDEYESWWGIETLPAINESSASYQEFILGENGVLKKWLRHGIGGFRLDVADELPDFFLKKLRTAVKEENPDAIILGEVWEDASNKIAYGVRREYFQGAELDSVMNYPLKDAIINFILSGDTTQLRETIFTLIDNYPKTVLDGLMNILGTHDTVRILTVLGGKYCGDKESMAKTFLTKKEKRIAIEKLKMAALLQFTLPGVPSIYYGDENGMEGYQDPFCRKCFNWENLNHELIDFYRLLGEIRTKKLKRIFADGEYKEIYADNSCLVFARKKENEATYIFTNNSSRDYTVTLIGQYQNILSEKIYENNLQIKGHSYGILVKIK